MSKFVYDFYYKVIEMLMKERKETEKQREAEETAAHRFQVLTPLTLEFLQISLCENTNRALYLLLLLSVTQE